MNTLVWILTICTSGWIICGSETTHKYETEEQCYRAMEELYDRHGEDSFNYLVCEPEVEDKKVSN